MEMPLQTELLVVEFAHYYHQPVKVDIYKIAVITPTFITLKSKSGECRNIPTTPYQPVIGTAIELYSEDSLIAWQNAINTYANTVLINTYKDNTDV